MNTIKEQIIQFNTEMNAVAKEVENIPKLSFIKALLRDKAQRNLENGSLDAFLFAKYSDKIEEQAEGQGNPLSSSLSSSSTSISKDDPFTSIGDRDSSPTICKEEFLEEVATIYASEIEGTVNENKINKLLQGKTEALSKTVEETKGFNSKGESFALNIILNDKQLHAKEMALSGKNYVLIGAAGTGKTTTQRSVAESLLLDSRLSSSTFKTYNALGERVYKSAPSIAFVAYTRRAASNLRKAIHKSEELKDALEHNIMTIHSLLEYEPETYWDSTEGKEKFRFAPRKTAENPLDITHLIIEEASMVGAHDLWVKLYDALPKGVQIIFIGDINQLPPVFGPSILNYALVSLPVVELTEVYRNQGVVLENAHNILGGSAIIEDENYRVVEPLGKDKKGNKVQVGQEKISFMLRGFFESLSTKVDKDGEAEYDPEDCMILSPWNKQALGTDNMNKHIAQFLGDKRKAVVHEVLAGMNKVYLAMNDKVMFNKRDGLITKIERNPAYFGREPQIPGSDLTRFGVRRLGEHHDSLDDVMIDYSNFNLEALEEEKAERKQQSSHVITVTYEDMTEDTLSATGDFAPQVFSLGYVLTVHKAQGSEWRKVFIILHKDFAVSLYRELFYTGATRARTKVTIIAMRDVIAKAINNQRIKGNTLKDKLEYFNSGADLRDSVPIIP